MGALLLIAAEAFAIMLFGIGAILYIGHWVRS